MANYDLDLKNFHATHLALWLALTKVSHAGYRYCDVTSILEHTITVKDGLDGAKCVLFLRQKDLYIVGFKNGAGHVFAFADQAPNAFNSRLDMSVNYAHVDGNAKSAAINHKTVVDAVNAFNDQADTRWNGLSLPFLTMALLVSESLRFKSIYEVMRGVVNDRSSGKTTRFDLWAPKVTSWNKDTTSFHAKPKLIQGPSQFTDEFDLKTWHRFQR